MKLPIKLNSTYEYDELQELVASMCRQKPIVCFSIFKTNQAPENAHRAGERVWFVDAPDIKSYHPVIPGKVQFVADYWRVSDEPVYSPVVENPTWRVIIDIFNDMLQQGDGCGIYLEGLDIIETKDDISTVRFQIGS